MLTNQTPAAARDRPQNREIVPGGAPLQRLPWPAESFRYPEDPRVVRLWDSSPRPSPKAARRPRLFPSLFLFDLGAFWTTWNCHANSKLYNVSNLRFPQWLEHGFSRFLSQKLERAIPRNILRRGYHRRFSSPKFLVPISSVDEIQTCVSQHKSIQIISSRFCLVNAPR